MKTKSTENTHMNIYISMKKDIFKKIKIQQKIRKFLLRFVLNISHDEKYNLIKIL